MQAIYDLVATEFTAVNDQILAELHSQVERVEDVSRHLVASGGKRIRPLIALLTAGALGNANSSLQIKLATVVEFLHTATLLHDDVVDMSSMRRGKPTANATWGNASSVLVGDFVYSRAFQLMVEIGSMPVMRIMSNTTVKIAEGEVKQLAEVGNVELDEPTYYSVIEHKTAQLFAAACQSAAVLAGSGSAIEQQLFTYGMHLGMAFQLIDDYLDYAGNSDDLGKQVGDDLAEGKLTLPLIHALKQLKQTDTIQYRKLLEIIAQKDVQKIGEVIDIVEQTGAMQYVMQVATERAQLSKSSLTQLPDSKHSQAMSDLAEFVIKRAN